MRHLLPFLAVFLLFTGCDPDEVETPDVLGCTDPDALNFEPNANVDNGECLDGPSFTCNDGTESVFMPNPLEFTGYDEYRVVQIGDQCWFADNLRTLTYLNGDEVISPLQEEWIQSGHTEPYRRVWGYGDADFVPCSIDPIWGLSGFWWDPCNDEEGVLNRYGYHYNGWAVMDERGLCPNGWHIPTDAEFQELYDFVTNEMGYSDNPAHVLRDGNDPFHTFDPAVSESTILEINRTGFSGGMIGYIHSNGGSYGPGGHWWTQSTSGVNENHRWRLRALYDDDFFDDPLELNSAASIRCIQD